MRPHLSDDILKRFAEGAIQGPVAVEVADHLDVCTACANRAALLDPLTSAFASLDEPAPPAALQHVVERALQEASRPQTSPWPPVLGLGFIFAAAVLSVSSGEALNLLRSAFTFAWALVVSATSVVRVLPMGSLGLVGAAVILAGSIAAFHLVGFSREAAG